MFRALTALLFVALCCGIQIRWDKRTPTGEVPVNVTASVFFEHGTNLWQIGGHKEMWYNNGTTDIIFYDSVWRYNKLSNRFFLEEISGSKPSPRAYAAHCSSGNVEYIYGGVNFGNDYSINAIYGDFWTFRSFGKKFNQLTSNATPGPRVGSYMECFDDKIILFGGICEITPYGLPIYCDDTWKFDFTTETWTLLNQTSHPSARQVPQKMKIGKIGYLNGGEYLNPNTFSFETPLDTWSFNYTSEKWQDITPQQYNLLPPRNYGASLLIDLIWFVYGGEMEGNQTFGCGSPFGQNVGSDLHAFSPIFEIWNQITPVGFLPPPLKRALSAGNFVFSGFDFICTEFEQEGQVYNQDMYILNIE